MVASCGWVLRELAKVTGVGYHGGVLAQGFKLVHGNFLRSNAEVEECMRLPPANRASGQAMETR